MDNEKTMTPRQVQPGLVLISGYARAGKDTMADGIMSVIPSKRLALADQLKVSANDAVRSIMAMAQHPWQPQLGFFDDQFKTTHRNVLVELGKTCRQIHPHVFIDCLINQSLNCLNHGISVVVPDVRYANEYNRLRSMAMDHGYMCRTMWVATEGVMPANDEERKNFDELVNEASTYITPFHSVTMWQPDSAEQIRKYGATMAHQWFINPKSSHPNG